MDWKPEALTAFERAWNDIHPTRTLKLCAALDAAIKAQGGVFMTPEQFAEKMAEAHGIGQISGYKDGRAEAFEEAAKAAIDFPAFEHGGLSCDPHYAARQASLEIAAAIRALAKEPKK